MEICQQLHHIDGVADTTNVTPLNSVPSPALITRSISSVACEKIKADTHLEVEYLKNIFNNLTVAIIMLDSHGYVRYSNNMAVEFFGVPLIGQLWRVLIERCFSQHANDDELVLKDGRIVKLETSPLDDKCGQVLIFSDVTRNSDLKKIRNHYARLAELGEMAASLAHQIRTPLAASLLFFSNIKKSLSASPDSYASLEKGISGLKHIEAMIKDMLIFSKGGKKGDDKLMVRDLIDELQQDSLVLMRDYGCDINIVDETENKELCVNRHAIKAALSNLIVNSAQACKDRQVISINDGTDINYKGDVKVTIKNGSPDNNSSTIILVEDNGVGISDDGLVHVKEPFYTTKSNGTGLGLAVTKSVLDSHGGIVDISSSVMKGTVITISLP